MDRILFGSNTIFIFKYPLMKHKLDLIYNELREQSPEAPEEELMEKAKELIAERGVTNVSDEEESKEGEFLRCDSYTQEEIDEDQHKIDWDTAYGEVIKIED